MDVQESIKMTKIGFENSFAEGNYYNLQTQNDKHLGIILDNLNIEASSKILDLGTGSGYVAFAIAQNNPKSKVVGLDIVSKTIEANNKKARELNLSNISFTAYDGLTLPFENNSFDVIVIRYALHHFPNIEETFKELARVLTHNGQLFISDPMPNEGDINGFVDAYMQMKQDGHIKFYTENEIITFSNNVGLRLDKLYKSDIRFPRKEAEKYRLLLANNHDVIKGYDIQIIADEIFITEQVLNLSFIKPE